MKNFRQILFQIVLAAIVLFSCKKENTIINVKSTEYFPNKVGNYWEYDVYDSSQIREHTDIPRRYLVKITIVGTKKLVDNIDAMIWKYEYPWGNETLYLRIENDSVKVYDAIRAAGITYIPYPNDLFINPFYDGQKWKSNLLWVDSFFVKKDTLLNYKNVYRIHRDYIGQQSYYHNDFWFSPQIGFLKKYRDEINQGIRTIELWQLKYYNLK